MMLVAARRNSAVPSHSEKRPQDCVPLSNGPPRMVPEWGPRNMTIDQPHNVTATQFVCR
jgi:hypothetical protein